MSIDREAIYQALYQRLKDKLLGAPFKTIGRRHVMPPDLDVGQQPALFVCAVRESSSPKPAGTGGKLLLSAMLFVYAYAPATNEPPGRETRLGETTLLALLRSIDDALAPDGPQQPWAGQNVQTLGGLVAHCWTEGDTDLDPGILGQQMFAIVPVTMLVA